MFYYIIYLSHFVSSCLQIYILFYQNKLFTTILHVALPMFTTNKYDTTNVLL